MLEPTGPRAPSRAPVHAPLASLPQPCGYCGHVIGPGDQEHAAHVVNGNPADGWTIARHACNERAKG